MRHLKSLVSPGTPEASRVNAQDYVSFADVVRQRIGGDVADACKHIDGVGARNLTSDPDISRLAIRFLGNYTEPDAMRIYEADVAECVRRFKKHEHQSG